MSSEKIERLVALLESWSNELSSVVDRVRLIIADAHWLTDGTYKEQIIQRWVKNYLSSNYSVGSGFIFSPLSSPNLSKQVDVLIVKNHPFPFWLREGELLIVSPKSLGAQIEVKSKLGLKELRLALQNIEAAIRVFRGAGCSGHIWAGIYAFGAYPSYIGSVPALRKLLQKLVDEASILAELEDWTISVLVHKHYIARVNNGENGLYCSGYYLGDLAAGVFLSDVLSHTQGLSQYNSDLTDCLDRLSCEQIRL